MIYFCNFRKAKVEIKDCWNCFVDGNFDKSRFRFLQDCQINNLELFNGFSRKLRTITKVDFEYYYEDDSELYSDTLFIEGEFEDKEEIKKYCEEYLSYKTAKGIFYDIILINVYKYRLI